MSGGAEIVATVVTEIAKPVVKTTLQELDYLLRPNKYVKKMNLLVQPIKEDHKILADAVVEAEGLGKKINPKVQLWLKSAGEIIARQEKLLSTDSKKCCLNGWCVDFGSRYKINKEAVGISESIPALPPAPESTSVALPPPPPTVVSVSGFMEFESTKGAMQEIVEALQDAGCGTIGIFGMGGIGKTSIVKRIAENVKKDGQFDQVVMAVVSQSPDLKKIQGEIASMLDLKFQKEAGIEGRASQLHERIMNLKSILVILDDVWARLVLGDIGIPGFVEHSGCKVMLTTRSEDVCTSMGTGNERKIKVGVLSKEESWELFKSNAGDAIENSSLKEVAAMVMNECQCLPLALRTVGRALRGKDIGVWKSAKLDLGKSITTNIEGMSKEVISCLRLSYGYLEGEDAKMCFLVCCLFPEDFEIPVELLVRYAIGKGLFQHASTADEARTLTETTFKKLKASCLLLEGGHNITNRGYHEGVKVHDVVRDVGLSIASEAKLLSRTGPDLVRRLQRNSMEHVKGACFAIDEDASLPQGVQCPELEDLCILAKNNIDYSDAFFETIKELKVLIHLGASQLNHNRTSRLPRSLKCLVSLRTLHLVRCELGDNVSAALGELKKLEILTINETNMKSLPEEVGQLTSLRLLDLMWNTFLKRIPGNVLSQLRQLEELYTGLFDDWEMEGTTSSGSGGGGDGDEEKGRERASLSELQCLPLLSILSVRVREFSRIPPKFSLPNKLVGFEIGVGPSHAYFARYPRCRALTLKSVEFQMEGVKSVLSLAGGDGGHEGGESGKYEFKSDTGNKSNYVLTDLAGGGGLNGLDCLTIQSIDWISSLTRSCNDDDDNKVVPVFANLRELRLPGVHSLRGLATGGGGGGGGGILGTVTTTGGGVLPSGSLQHLTFLEILYCDGLEGWAVPWSWTYRLHNLEKLPIQYCKYFMVI